MMPCHRVARPSPVPWLLVAALAVGSAGCAGEGSSATSAAVDASAPSVVTPGATDSPTTAPPTTALRPTVPATTLVPTSTTTGPPDLIQTVEVGRSVQGRPIVAIERGTPGGTRVLVIGAIHGDEDAGLAIIEELLQRPVPDGIDLWLVPTINPDGVALQQRQNANGVDLNRNFPYRWGPIAEPGDWEWAGVGPASEPETQAAVALISWLQPDLGVWYHQDLHRINPSDGLDGEVRQRYAELTGLPVLGISGGTYTGVAATWQRHATDGVAFIVELGPTLSDDEARTHADAVLQVVDLVR